MAENCQKHQNKNNNFAFGVYRCHKPLIKIFVPSERQSMVIIGFTFFKQLGMIFHIFVNHIQRSTHCEIIFIVAKVWFSNFRKLKWEESLNPGVYEGGPLSFWPNSWECMTIYTNQCILNFFMIVSSRLFQLLSVINFKLHSHFCNLQR